MISLRRYIEGVRASDQEALRVAKHEIDRRLDQMNELREQLHAERNHYLSTATYDLRHEELERRITTIELWRANLAGRATVFGILAVLAVGASSALVTHLVGG